MVGSGVQVAVKPGQISPPQTCYPTARLNVPTRPDICSFLFSQHLQKPLTICQGENILNLSCADLMKMQKTKVGGLSKCKHLFYVSKMHLL